MKSNEIIVGDGERISISFRKRKHARYLAEEADDGTITLIPAALVPAYKLTPEDPKHGITRADIPSINEIREKIREMPLWKERM